VLKTKNLRGFGFLTIRSIRTKAPVETRIEHADIGDRLGTIGPPFAAYGAQAGCLSRRDADADEALGLKLRVQDTILFAQKSSRPTAACRERRRRGERRKITRRIRGCTNAADRKGPPYTRPRKERLFGPPSRSRGSYGKAQARRADRCCLGRMSRTYANLFTRSHRTPELDVVRTERRQVVGAHAYDIEAGRR
jgi:hypothetical protein